MCFLIKFNLCANSFIVIRMITIPKATLKSGSGETSKCFEHAFDLQAVFVRFRNHTYITLECIEYSELL